MLLLNKCPGWHGNYLALQVQPALQNKPAESSKLTWGRIESSCEIFIMDHHKEMLSNSSSVIHGEFLICFAILHHAMHTKTSLQRTRHISKARVVELTSSQASALESLSKLLASFEIAFVIWVECRKGTLGGTLTTLLQNGQ